MPAHRLPDQSQPGRGVDQYFAGNSVERELGGYSGRHEHFSFTNARGLRIAGILFASGLETKPTVLYLHGNGGSKMEMLPLIRADFARNFNFCGIDFAGCGQSEGDRISYGVHEAADIESLVQYLRARHRVKDLHLWGRSMGAAAAILFCAGGRAAISSMVLDSPFAALEQVVSNVAAKERIPWIAVFLGMFFVKSKVADMLGFDIFGIDYAQTLGTYADIPILFGFSHSDQVVRPEDVHEVYSAYRGEKYLLEIKSNHSEERPKEFSFEALRFVHTKSKITKK